MALTLCEQRNESKQDKQQVNISHHIWSAASLSCQVATICAALGQSLLRVSWIDCNRCKCFGSDKSEPCSLEHFTLERKNPHLWQAVRDRLANREADGFVSVCQDQFCAACSDAQESLGLRESLAFLWQKWARLDTTHL